MYIVSSMEVQVSDRALGAIRVRAVSGGLLSKGFPLGP